MDFYRNRSFLNILLLIVGVLILLITVVYANYLANELSEREDKNERLYEEALVFMANNLNLESDVGLADQIIQKYNLPVIYKDGNIYGGYNWGERLDTSQVFLKKKVQEFIDTGQKPIPGEAVGPNVTIYTFKSKLSKYITFFPIVQFVLLGFFIALGYFFFNAARRGEQNRVWAGMAKETAHQLGTPIRDRIFKGIKRRST